MADIENKRKKRSIHTKQNIVYQTFLAGLVILLSVIFIVVLLAMKLPTSSVWQDNVLLRMIRETQEYNRNR